MPRRGAGGRPAIGPQVCVAVPAEHLLWIGDNAPEGRLDFIRHAIAAEITRRKARARKTVTG